MQKLFQIRGRSSIWAAWVAVIGVGASVIAGGWISKGLWLALASIGGVGYAISSGREQRERGAARERERMGQAGDRILAHGTHEITNRIEKKADLLVAKVDGIADSAAANEVLAKQVQFHEADAKATRDELARREAEHAAKTDWSEEVLARAVQNDVLGSETVGAFMHVLLSEDPNPEKMAQMRDLVTKHTRNRLPLSITARGRVG